MALEGYKDIPIERMGSLVTSYATEKLPEGVSPWLRNVRFGLNSVATRYGVQATIKTGKAASAGNGLGMLVTTTGQTNTQTPIIFNSDGTLSKEISSGAGTVLDLSPSQFTWTAGTYTQMAPWFQRLYMANGDMKSGVGSPAVTDGTYLDPLSQRPFGETWVKSTLYNVGEMICPTTSNGHIYRCTTKGTSAAAEPSWPVTDGGTVADGSCNWKEYTVTAGNVVPIPTQPAIARSAGAGTFAANRDVYIILTFVNPQGETLISSSSSIINTVLNDRVIVTAPTVPSWLSGLGGSYAVTGYNVYQADVATGGAAPSSTTYKKVNGGAVALGVNTNVDAAGAGAAPPTATTARIVPAGNICSGIRYLSVIFVNRFGNLSGFSTASIQSVNIDVNNFRIFAGNIPVGPDNCVQRIVTIGPAGQASSGPFTFEPITTTANGIPITTSVINDNTTTSATLNFTDDYASTATLVTKNLRKIKLPPQADVQFIPSLKRFVFTGEQPSLARWSEPSDPETFYGDTGYSYIARDDGERLVTHREWKTQVYAFKERGGYIVKADNRDPIFWGADKLWSKVGPSGPQAIDCGNDFMAFAHRSGAYLYSSTTPTWVSEEITDLWAQINWTYGHLICVLIDDEAKEVRFAVPMGTATKPNVILTMNFARGIDKPIHFSSFSGKEIARPDARKWSIDDIPCGRMIRAERQVSINGATASSEILIASPDNDGTINMIATGTYNDNALPIKSWYDLASVGGGGSVFQLGGFTIAAKGQGKAALFSLPYHGDPRPIRSIDLGLDDNRYYRRQARGNSRQWGLRISNNQQADCWFELFSVNVHIRPMWKSESAFASRN